MSVVLRLARHGRKKVPFYRLVAADKQMKRDGRFLELLGTLNPLSNPHTVTLKQERIQYWIGVGATTSDTVAQLIEKEMPGFLSGVETKRKSKIRSQRAKRKANTGKANTKVAK
jgi:small subunit ribosomal protein S16